jgi:hypothetical protein
MPTHCLLHFFCQQGSLLQHDKFFEIIKNILTHASSYCYDGIGISYQIYQLEDNGNENIGYFVRSLQAL